MKIIKYITVGGDSAFALDEAVNEHLQEGYELYGSPYLTDRQVEGVVGDFVIYQAMVMSKETASEREKAKAEIKVRIKKFGKK